MDGPLSKAYTNLDNLTTLNRERDIIRVIGENLSHVGTQIKNLLFKRVERSMQQKFDFCKPFINFQQFKNHPIDWTGL